jgi:hypothetical protein
MRRNLPMLVHIIADYGPTGDLAFSEVVQRIKLHLPDAEPVLTPVPAFATLAAGFCIAQLGLNDAPPGTIIYHNVAPRQDLPEARAGNAGERLAFARLHTGVRVIGANAGHAFSFVREGAEDLRWAAVPEAGSQFRSRDFFPQAAGALALGRPDALGEVIDPDDIPAVPAGAIAYIDGYGNLKTTWPADDRPAPSGTELRIRIGEREHDVVVSDGTFAVAQGHMSFAPGSSGWTSRQGKETVWMEIFLRGANAWEAFARPQVGDRVEIVGR